MPKKLHPVPNQIRDWFEMRGGVIFDLRFDVPVNPLARKSFKGCGGTTVSWTRIAYALHTGKRMRGMVRKKDAALGFELSNLRLVQCPDNETNFTTFDCGRPSAALST